MTKVKANINYKGLKKLVEEISKDNQIKVGLLSGAGGSDIIKDHDGNLNQEFDYAGLGALMEYGSKDGKIPARSFLQMPLEEKASEIVEKVRMGMSKEEIKYYLENNIIDLKNFAVVLGASCVDAIQEAFDTHGFNQWQPNAPYTIEKKGSSSPLIDTGALRSKIIAEVVTEDGTMYTGGKQ